MTDHTTTRRAVLAGSAALPVLALPALATAEMDDPAIAAVEAWLAKCNEWSEYRSPEGVDWEDDPDAMAIETEADARLVAIGDAQPTTAAGLALGLATILYDQNAVRAGSTFHDADSWFWKEANERTTADKVTVALWRSPAAAEVFARIGQTPTGAAALPSRRAADPAAEAARRWIAAASAEAAYAYDGFGDGDWDDDPRAVALSSEERLWWQAMLDTPPTTPDALALMLACCLYGIEQGHIGSHFSDPDSWYGGGTEGHGIMYALLPVLWNSPAAAKLFPRTVPPVDPATVTT